MATITQKFKKFFKKARENSKKKYQQAQKQGL